MRYSLKRSQLFACIVAPIFSKKYKELTRYSQSNIPSILLRINTHFLYQTGQKNRFIFWEKVIGEIVSFSEYRDFRSNNKKLHSELNGAFILFSLLLRWSFFCSGFFGYCFFYRFLFLLERIRYLICDHLFHFIEREHFDLFHFGDFLAISLEIDILLTELDEWTISTILDGDLQLWPVVDIAICLFIDLRRYQSIRLCLSEIIKIEPSWNIDIE